MAAYSPLKYRFCTDERADTTLAWCNRFDEGASYREIVRNVTEDYDMELLCTGVEIDPGSLD